MMDAGAKGAPDAIHSLIRDSFTRIKAYLAGTICGGHILEESEALSAASATIELACIASSQLPASESAKTSNWTKMHELWEMSLPWRRYTTYFASGALGAGGATEGAQGAAEPGPEWMRFARLLQSSLQKPDKVAFDPEFNKAWFHMFNRVREYLDRRPSESTLSASSSEGHHEWDDQEDIHPDDVFPISEQALDEAARVLGLAMPENMWILLVWLNSQGIQATRNGHQNMHFLFESCILCDGKPRRLEDLLIHQGYRDMNAQTTIGYALCPKHRCPMREEMAELRMRLRETYRNANHATPPAG